MNNNLLKLVVFAILFFIFAVAFNYFKNINRPANTTPAYVTYSDIDREVKQTPKEIFVDACMAGGRVGRQFCSCSYEYIVEKIGVNGMIKMGMEYNETGESPAIATEAAEYCLSK